MHLRVQLCVKDPIHLFFFSPFYILSLPCKILLEEKVSWLKHFFFLKEVLDIEPRTSYILSTCFTTELYPTPKTFFLITLDFSVIF